VEEETLWDALATVRDFVVQTKVFVQYYKGNHLSNTLQTLPTLLLNFFARFFQVWSGIGNHAIIFDILGFTPLKEYEGETRTAPVDTSLFY
jgi:centromere protein I